MRRFIAYIAMCSALILGVGAAISPTDRESQYRFGLHEGKTLTFRVFRKDTDKNRNGYDPEYALTEADGMDPVNAIADTMRPASIPGALPNIASKRSDTTRSP
jgi:hypothetical protein